jgi:ABC-2 type transport system permease protein
MASILDKDIRLFFRDNSQWSQLFLLGALVVVYLYNFSVLPLERSPMRLDFLQNTIAFLNLGLAGFVLSAVSVRFIFPAISSEGRAFWIVRSSPIRAQRFIMVKFMLYVLPMLFLGEILVVVTNHLLQVTPFMMILSTVTMFFMVFGLISLGIGLGVIYPKFGHENIAQVATGFGGLIYMILSALFIAVIIIIESGPVYILFMADLKGIEITPAQWLIMVLSFFLLLIIIAFAVYKPLKTGIIALENYE